MNTRASLTPKFVFWKKDIIDSKNLNSSHDDEELNQTLSKVFSWTLSLLFVRGDNLWSSQPDLKFSSHHSTDHSSSLWADQIIHSTSGCTFSGWMFQISFIYSLNYSFLNSEWQKKKENFDRVFVVFWLIHTMRGRRFGRAEWSSITVIFTHLPENWFVWLDLIIDFDENPEWVDQNFAISQILTIVSKSFIPWIRIIFNYQSNDLAYHNGPSHNMLGVSFCSSPFFRI